MTLRTLIKRSLRFHWRSHLGVVIGAAIGSAALIGALIVGDSVKGSLREQNLARIGNRSWLLHSSERFFTEQLPMRVRCEANLMALRESARRYQNKSADLPTCINPNLPERTMLLLPGTAARGDASQRVNEVQIVGISDFAPVLLSSAEVMLRKPRLAIALTNEAVVNSTLAMRLGIKAGETVLLRFTKPGRMSADHAVATRNQANGTLRLVVRSVATNGEIANFSPHTGTVAPASAFVPLTELARVAGLQQVHEVSYSITKADPNDGDDETSSTITEERKERVEINRVNVWLSPEVVHLLPSSRLSRGSFWSTLDRWLGWAESRLGLKNSAEANQTRPLETGKQAIVLADLLRQSWDFDNLQVAELINDSGHLSLHTPRVFLDPPLIRSALAADTNAQPLLTYLANLISVGSNAAPYSMVTAAGAPWTPAGLRDDEIILNQWLADDLQAKPGDALTLVYFDPESGARLTERTNTFRVHSIVPMEMPWADRTLMCLTCLPVNPIASS